MKQSLFTMEHARQLTADTYELVLSGDTSAITAPGQFVNIQLPGKFLRRPISICNWTKDALLLLVRVVGEGTHDLVRCVPGTELDVLSGLGNGFDLAKGGAHPILLGGGIGIAPLYGLAQRMLEAGIAPTVGLGFRSGGDAFYLEEFGKLGCRLMVATEDGSFGRRVARPSSRYASGWVATNTRSRSNRSSSSRSHALRWENRRISMRLTARAACASSAGTAIAPRSQARS